jgi:hypothetical protein
MRPVTLIAALACVTAVGIAAAALHASAERRMVPATTVVNESFASLDAAARRGDPKERVAALHDDAIRSADALRARPEHRRGEAVRRIRAFRGNESLPLTYVGTSSNPYRDDEADIETYVDAHGTEYWIDPSNDVLVQAGPGPGADQKARAARPETRRPVAELREIAVAVAAAQAPEFLAIRSTLHPLEDNKGREIYFFRWDDLSRPVRETEMPPFVQVGLFADGSVASFTNTLTR